MKQANKQKAADAAARLEQRMIAKSEDKLVRVLKRIEARKALQALTNRRKQRVHP
jgi:hypothetical protein